MRFTTASTFLTAAVSALDASVYVLKDGDSTPPTLKGPAISADNSRLVLAHHLGLSKYHKLAGADQDTLELLNNDQIPLFDQSRSSKKLLVVVEGLENDLLDIPSTFTISNAPSVDSNAQLISDFLLQDMHSRDATLCGKQPMGGLISGGISAFSPAGLCWLEPGQSRLGLSLEEQMDFLHTRPESMQFSDNTYVKSGIRYDYTAIYHVKILQEHNVQSAEYKDALKAIRKWVKEGVSGDTILVGMPRHQQMAKRDSYGSYAMPLVARKELPLTDMTQTSTASHTQATSPSNRTIPKTTISVCWSSESACKSNTADCSGYGSCKLKYSEKASDDESGAECWACACTPTVLQVSGGQKTINWGGPACQKKDISMPFFLFAGFTIAALAALSYGIGLLYSIGEEDLPSVLGAGVAPPSRK